MSISDPYNPTPDEIRGWAFTVDAVEPVQDWDLMLATSPYESLYLELASDYACPNQGYFLALLYLIVGDAVRTAFRNTSEGHLRGLLERSRSYKHPAVKAWRHRARELLKRPESFDYALWCAGGHAREDLG